MAKIRVVILLAILSTSLFAQNVRTIDFLNDTLAREIPPTHNPFLTTSLSIIPGGGQFATKNWLKGTLMLGLNGVFWSQAVINYMDLDEYRTGITYADTLGSIGRERDSLNLVFEDIMADTLLDTTAQADSLMVIGTELIASHHSYGQIKIDETWEKRATQNWFIWAGSMYLWNLMDGYGSANTFQGSQKPSPRRAALLSAIPFSGAGQWYNGSPFKAGLVMSTQVGFFVSAINFSVLRHEIEDEGLAVVHTARNLIDGGDTLYLSDSQRDVWRDDYNKAGSIRTQFLWYGVIFYIYGIVDAYVDASLYGFNRKFDITGGYTPGKNEFAMAFTMKF